MCDIQNNGKIQREFETRSTDDQPTIQWLPVVGSWTFLGVNMHFNEKLFMCDSCNFLVRAYLYQVTCNWQHFTTVSLTHVCYTQQYTVTGKPLSVIIVSTWHIKYVIKIHLNIVALYIPTQLWLTFNIGFLAPELPGVGWPVILLTLLTL